MTEEPPTTPARRDALRRGGALLLAALGGCAHETDPRLRMPRTMNDTSFDALDDDPLLWLEEVDGDRALAWVRERNAQTRARLEAVPGHAQRREQIRAVLDSDERIPAVSRRGDWLYNLWRDEQHPRGLWRRTTLAEYRKAQPAWQLILDLDALAAAEGENWVWGGVQSLGPEHRRCLMSLSRGGADATVVREFDCETRQFVAGGFELPEAKSDVSWIDQDTIYVGTDFGPGSLTTSGYVRILKRWRRGQPLSQAQTVFEAEADDISADVAVDRTPGHERTVFSRALDFYRSRSWLQRPDGSLQPLDKPEDAGLSFWRDEVLLELRSAYTAGGTTHPAGTLLIARAADYLAGRPQWQVLFAPTPGRSLDGWTVTRSAVLTKVLEHVAGKLEEHTRAAPGTPWTRRVVDTPGPGTLGVAAWRDTTLADDPLAEHYLLTYQDFLTPERWMLGRTGTDARELLKTEPAFFDPAGLVVRQHFATSKDGTRVPYFVIGPAAAPPPGGRPTLLLGYGGFEVSYQPYYSGVSGRAWLAQGGVTVMSNIRGGGEYGPAWHQAGSRQFKQNSFDDFIAVAEDLIARGISSPPRLAIEGGSNGGLLVGAVMLQRPGLFGAVVCQVPLLDMRRYHRLLAGASWMAEYGNPDDPAEWAWIAPYSPYQNVRPGMKLPPVLFTTSTRDDRVHPGHARKMAARMIGQGHEVLYLENIEGGHGGAADNGQRADLAAVEFSFLWERLGPKAA